MTSEELPPSTTAQAHEPGEASDLGDPSATEQGSDPRGDRRLDLTDPKAIRALAHPLRWALLEALVQAGSLTATQASEMLGESPANCAFHLRTLAKYGFVEEAGGGRGRERPWRRTYNSYSWRTIQDDPQATQAAEALDQVWLDRSLARARRSLTSMSSWPKGLSEALGGSTSALYLTPDEANEVYVEIQQTFSRLTGPDRYPERRDPKMRPADSLPFEFILLGYPMLDLPPLPAADDGAEGGETDDDTLADGLATPD